MFPYKTILFTCDSWCLKALCVGVSILQLSIIILLDRFRWYRAKWPIADQWPTLDDIFWYLATSIWRHFCHICCVLFNFFNFTSLNHIGIFRSFTECLTWGTSSVNSPAFETIGSAYAATLFLGLLCRGACWTESRRNRQMGLLVANDHMYRKNNKIYRILYV